MFGLRAVGINLRLLVFKSGNGMTKKNSCKNVNVSREMPLAALLKSHVTKRNNFKLRQTFSLNVLRSPFSEKNVPVIPPDNNVQQTETPLRDFFSQRSFVEFSRPQVR